MAKFILDDHTVISGDHFMDIFNMKEDESMLNTNRDYIKNTSEYDMLIKIQHAIDNGCKCIPNALSDKHVECVDKSGNVTNDPDKHCCDVCIRQWLNCKI